jgi:hypothetical protein
MRRAVWARHRDSSTATGHLLFIVYCYLVNLKDTRQISHSKNVETAPERAQPGYCCVLSVFRLGHNLVIVSKVIGFWFDSTKQNVETAPD